MKSEAGGSSPVVWHSPLSCAANSSSSSVVIDGSAGRLDAFGCAGGGVGCGGGGRGAGGLPML